MTTDDNMPAQFSPLLAIKGLAATASHNFLTKKASEMRMIQNVHLSIKYVFPEFKPFSLRSLILKKDVARENRVFRLTRSVGDFVCPQCSNGLVDLVPIWPVSPETPEWTLPTLVPGYLLENSLFDLVSATQDEVFFDIKDIDSLYDDTITCYKQQLAFPEKREVFVFSNLPYSSIIYLLLNEQQHGDDEKGERKSRMPNMQILLTRFINLLLKVSGSLDVTKIWEFFGRNLIRHYRISIKDALYYDIMGIDRRSYEIRLQNALELLKRIENFYSLMKQHINLSVQCLMSVMELLPGSRLFKANMKELVWIKDHNLGIIPSIIKFRNGYTTIFPQMSWLFCRPRIYDSYILPLPATTLRNHSKNVFIALYADYTEMLLLCLPAEFDIKYTSSLDRMSAFIKGQKSLSSVHIFYNQLLPFAKAVTDPHLLEGGQ